MTEIHHSILYNLNAIVFLVRVHSILFCKVQFILKGSRTTNTLWKLSWCRTSPRQLQDWQITPFTSLLSVTNLFHLWLLMPYIDEIWCDAGISLVLHFYKLEIAQFVAGNIALNFLFKRSLICKKEKISWSFSLSLEKGVWKLLVMIFQRVA